MHTMPNAKLHTSRENGPFWTKGERKGLAAAPPPAFGPPPAFSLETEPPWLQNMVTSNQPKKAIGAGGRHVQCSQVPSHFAKFFSRLDFQSLHPHSRFRDAHSLMLLYKCVHPYACNNVPCKCSRENRAAKWSKSGFPTSVPHYNHQRTLGLAAKAMLQNNEIRISGCRYPASVLF